MIGVREQLISAAETLFAERGVEGVSLREINAAAGARNASAVQYHLRDRAGVITAILERHRPEVEARRHALLDEIEARGEPVLRDVAGAYVRPLAAKLTDAPGYLQVLADLVSRPHPAVAWVTSTEPTDSTFRWREMVAPLISPAGLELHRRFTAIQFTHLSLAQRAREDRGGDQRLWTSHLVDLVTALLAAPVSDETLRLLAATRPARRGRPATRS